MFHQILLSTFTLFTLSACTGQKVMENNKPKSEKTAEPLVLNNTEDPIKSNMGNIEIIHLDEGKDKFVNAAEMTVSFKKVIEDSRCPTDVQCVWAGVATVDIQLMGTFTRPTNIKISTMDDVEKGYSNSAIFNGYRISLLELNPYPKNGSDKKLNAGKHRIKLQIVKIAENQIEMNVK